MGNPDQLSQMPSRVDSNLSNSSKDQVFVEELEDNTRSVIQWSSQNFTVFPEIGNANFPCHITQLFLNFNNIGNLPLGLPQILSDLQIFSMDGNELSKLPDDFGDMLSLEELYISENKLTSLPNSLCKLSKLRILKVCCNGLRSLHPEIGQNTCLETLSVDENYLRRLPPTLGLLKNLKILEANSNKLTSLPETVHFLESLETVDLSKNRLSKVPDSFSELKCLKHIDLSENQMVTLWASSNSSLDIEKIYLDFNSIITLPPWFSDLENVKEISLNSNNLSCNSLPEGFGYNLSQLKLLDLRGNFITELPNSFGAIDSLETLLLGSPFDYLEKKATFQNGNWLRQFPKTFGDLRSLVSLGAEENQLAFLPESIGNLINLKELYLGSNLLTSLPDTFCSLHSLEKCQLSKNKIKALPEAFGNLQSLIELHLDLNKLKSLPLSLRKCVSLEIFDLSDNRLTEVPKDILTCLFNLKALNMQQNRFDVPYCDIPHIAKKAHYKELNPCKRDNWRGRNNSPFSVYENYLHKQQDERPSSNCLEQDNCSGCDGNEEEESKGSNQGNVFWDSSEDEDWEKECIQSVPGTAHQSSQCFSEEENWDDEIESPVAKSQVSGCEVGQFDLDEEQPDVPLPFQPISFDFYGNPSHRIDLDIYHHRMLPYVFHPRSHLPLSRGPCTVEDGQFEDFED